MRRKVRKSRLGRRLRPVGVGSLLMLASLIILSWGCGASQSAPTTPTVEPGAKVEHWKGNKDARVVIEEWTDLQ